MARRRFFLINRVVLGLLAFFILTALWEFRWKPQYRGFYEDGVQLYHSGKYLEAQRVLDHAYEIAPNALDVIIMEGWTNLKLNHWEEARFYFDRALKIDPRTEEAQLGSSFVTLETGRGKLDPVLLNRILETRKNDPNVLILLAGAEEQQGEYFKAADIYNRLVGDKDYGPAAQLAVQRIFGLSGFNDSPISSFPPYSRPLQLQTPYRAGNGSFWRQTSAGGWARIYLQGADLGAAAPGFRPTSLPNEGAMYAGWLNDASQLHANTLRVYSLLPPAFYRAFHHDAANRGKLSLVQQVWLAEPEDQNLFQPEFEEQIKADIRYTVDAIHGRGEVPARRTHGSGIYEFDVADRVSAYVIGSDISPKVIERTNGLNGGNRSFDGTYLSVTNATATEVWLVQMADYLLGYEVATYNWQHPVAILSGPAPDPSSNTLLEAKVKIKPACVAGIFAAYPVSPFYPDYMERNPRYANARDREGPNPAAAIVRDLRAHLPVPLVVGEYGVSSSITPRSEFASGWNQGGYSENTQADALIRLTRTLRSAGIAGGLVFEMADEWYREGWLAEGFQVSGDKASLFLNDMDPAKRYGLTGYRTSKWRLFNGDPAEWEKERKIEPDAPAPHLGDAYDGERAIRALQIAADEGYLYLRLQVACLDCAGTKHTNKIDFSHLAYAIALNTRPGAAGIRELPFGVNLATGANFLLLLRDPQRSRMLVAETYNPFQLISRARDPRLKQIVYKPDFTSTLSETGTFQPVAEEENPGQLWYGQGNPDARDYDSRTEWYADLKHNAILIRIPWGKLLVTDPSSTQVFATYSKTDGVRSVGTVGVEASAYVLEPKGSGEINDMAVTAAIPANHPPQPFLWPRWDSVRTEPYHKKAFAAISQEFGRSAGTQ